ncbi:Cys/Met metabolism, pyridoxal phosphate-dependent enzyme [Kipferlia bialata]|uniref:Cys/Met metabolism, pyridoxal phosphate-dependent enzyme n=1 Tax=Kipferlia bialata TaxID=797122 RepID=A0A9K3GF76_9EUKA|nr:Cys/Met metabolism, pyridoxal phosphate-dependent enzyme [Kipferlia bialata]|eukprot:g1361.t1
MPSTHEHHHFNSTCVHAGYGDKECAENAHALAPPIYATSTFTFDSAADMRDTFSGKKEGYIYTRISNPTSSVAEARLAALDGTEAACVFASGIGSICATCYTFLKAGDHMIASSAIYGCTYAYMSHILPKFGVEVDFVDTTDMAAMEAAMKENTKIVFFEAVANPVCRLTDVRAVSDMVHAKNKDCLVVVDNTFTTSYVHRPMEHGADLVVYSLTKGMIGSGTALAGAVVGPASLLGPIRFEGLKDCTGAVCDARVSHALINGLKTLHVRIQRHGENCEKVVAHVAKKVGKGVDVLYCPSHPTSPYYEVSKKMLDGYCLVMAFELTGGFDAAEKFMDALKFCKRAVSLGDAETLVCAPAVSTHATYSPEARAKYGIAEGLVRISVGLEHADDIIADLEQAFVAAGVQ